MSLNIFARFDVRDANLVRSEEQMVATLLVNEMPVRSSMMAFRKGELNLTIWRQLSFTFGTVDGHWHPKADVDE